ncbi:hypothetical protein Ciccas_002823 [Cichlidogyrus casuarinus]|uniref:Uncharacterized protein n=1 Tax=Cichlidogyrus casuarinus TaxID=1844966 RepID=A0ABD2QG61_9PLAT
MNRPYATMPSASKMKQLRRAKAKNGELQSNLEKTPTKAEPNGEQFDLLDYSMGKTPEKLQENGRIRLDPDMTLSNLEKSPPPPPRSSTNRTPINNGQKIYLDSRTQPKSNRKSLVNYASPTSLPPPTEPAPPPPIVNPDGTLNRKARRSIGAVEEAKPRKSSNGGFNFKSFFHAFGLRSSPKQPNGYDAHARPVPLKEYPTQRYHPNDHDALRQLDMSIHDPPSYARSPTQVQVRQSLKLS